MLLIEECTNTLIFVCKINAFTFVNKNVQVNKIKLSPEFIN